MRCCLHKGVVVMIKGKDVFINPFMVLALSLALQNLLTYGVNPDGHHDARTVQSGMPWAA